MKCIPSHRLLAPLLASVLAMLPLAGHTEAEGRLFRPLGENLMISPPPGWRLAYMDGDPEGNYVVDFLPPSSRRVAALTAASRREGFMRIPCPAVRAEPGAVRGRDG